MLKFRKRFVALVALDFAQGYRSNRPGFNGLAAASGPMAA
jgi:hypothetical protein